MAVAVQTDGNVVVAGWNQAIAGCLEGSLSLARYTPEGVLDPGFGAGGFVCLELTPGIEVPLAVRVLDDGEIVVAVALDPGTPGADPLGVVAIRFLPNGSIDSSFGVSGVARHDLPNGSRLNAATVSEDGSVILVGARFDDPDFTGFVIRFTPGGSPDPALGSNGVATVALPHSDGSLRAVDLPFDGAVVVGGWATDGATSTGFLAKLTSSGVLDGSFGLNGIAVVTAEPTAVALLETGQILSAEADTNGIVTIRPRSAIGASHPSFTAQVVDDGVSRSVVDIASQPTGKIVLAGSIDAHASLIRLLPDGPPDPGFGIDGVAAVQAGQSSQGKPSQSPPTGRSISSVRAWSVPNLSWAHRTRRG
ncbi:MAG: delta-60 repeat domain-containing protein [Acidimicrobiia bacterium]